MKKAFTLAEVLITLTVIGIITAVIIPVAIHSKPDENIMKFKKAHNTLYQVISTLINSDEYYLDGDLGAKPDGSIVDSATYFCETFSDVITVKKANCTKRGDYHNSYWAIEQPKADIDLSCLLAQKSNVDEITLADGVLFYEGSTAVHFGAKGTPTGLKADGNGFEINNSTYLFYDNLLSNNINRVYKFFV